MEELTTLEQIKTLDELTGALNLELNRAAISFVRIGYLLKTARDTDILKDSPYENINDYAKDRFGLDKSQVSRFININDNFSIGGYSEHLKIEYEGFGQAKLALMLTLPMEINEELSPSYSKTDIQAIKEEVDAEKKITPLELMTEPKTEEPETDGDEFIAMLVKQLNDEHPGPINDFHFNVKPLAEKLGLAESIKTPKGAEPDIQECYMPDEECAYNIRISGMGRFLISMKDAEITATNIRTLEKSRLSWLEFTEAVLEDEARREFKKPESTEETKAKKEKVHQSAIQKKQKEVQKRYEEAKTEEKKLENDENGTKNDENAQNPTENAQKPTEEIEKVEGEVVDSEGQCIDNAPQNIPYPDGEEPEITHVSSEDPLPKENNEAAGEEEPEEVPEAPEPVNTELSKEEKKILQLNDLVNKDLERVKDYLDMIKPEKRYRESLDEISSWTAQITNTVGELYAILAYRGM